MGDRGELVALIEAVRALPYGRPSERTVAAMLREGRGTCSTKHLYLCAELRRRFPETAPLLVHRVYRVDRAAVAGDDPDADKRCLEQRYCDARVREPFIAALSQAC